MSKYQATAHVTYKIGYHVVFYPKYRYNLLRYGAADELKRLLAAKASNLGTTIQTMEVMPDHVHLLIDCNPRYGIMQCVIDLKKTSSYIMIREFPEIRRKLPAMWTRSCFVSTVGTVSLERVKQYIEDQKGK